MGSKVCKKNINCNRPTCWFVILLIVEDLAAEDLRGDDATLGSGKANGGLEVCDAVHQCSATARAAGESVECGGNAYLGSSAFPVANEAVVVHGAALQVIGICFAAESTGVQAELVVRIPVALLHFVNMGSEVRIEGGWRPVDVSVAYLYFA